MNDYLIHFGVKGMKWGVRNDDDEESSKEPSKKEKKKAQLKEYRSDKGPKKVMNVANSAARSYYRSMRTNDVKRHISQEEKANTKAAGLTENQVKNGRYRVARARSIKRNVLSVAGGATLAGAATAITGGAALILAPAIVAATSVPLHFATGAHYYGKQRKAYGSTRAKYQTQSQGKK